MSNKECVICLSQLETYEQEFPLLCPSKCPTNACTNCSLVLQQQQQQQQSSDKTNPSSSCCRCPNCKADISRTINDTNLMRFVAKYGTSCVEQEKPDSELSGTELRFKYCTTKQEIEEAKRRLEHAYEDRDNMEKDQLAQCGSNKIPNSSSSRSTRLEKAVLYGLEGFVSVEERSYILDLMTSGDPSKLAQAAHILFEIRHLNNLNHGNDSRSDDSVMNSIRSLLYQKTSEVEAKVIKKLSMATALETKLVPLPKHIVLKADFDVYARYGKLIKFKDDGWDGSLSDAFSRMYSDQDDDDDDKKNKNRVIVTEARRQAAKAGIEKGDVVTHVNMEEFRGDADALRAKIHGFYNMSSGTGNAVVFSMTMNADQITADELKKIDTSGTI